MKTIKELSLKDAVALAVNSFNAGIESKQDTIDHICKYVEEHYIEKKAILNIPAKVLNDLNLSYGLISYVEAGKLKDIKKEDGGHNA